jgi:hypothetical protein
MTHRPPRSIVTMGPDVEVRKRRPRTFRDGHDKHVQ